MVEYLREQGEPNYIDGHHGRERRRRCRRGRARRALLRRALDFVREKPARRRTSMIQRHLKIGYNRAANIIDQLEARRRHRSGRRRPAAGGHRPSVVTGQPSEVRRRACSDRRSRPRRRGPGRRAGGRVPEGRSRSSSRKIEATVRQGRRHEDGLRADGRQLRSSARSTQTGDRRLQARPGKMRWDFVDEGKHFVTGGGTMWVYLEADNQVVQVHGLGRVQLGRVAAHQPRQPRRTVRGQRSRPPASRGTQPVAAPQGRSGTTRASSWSSARTSPSSTVTVFDAIRHTKTKLEFSGRGTRTPSCLRRPSPSPEPARGRRSSRRAFRSSRHPCPIRRRLPPGRPSSRATGPSAAARRCPPREPRLPEEPGRQRGDGRQAPAGGLRARRDPRRRRRHRGQHLLVHPAGHRGVHRDRPRDGQVQRGGHLQEARGHRLHGAALRRRPSRASCPRSTTSSAPGSTTGSPRCSPRARGSSPKSLRRRADVHPRRAGAAGELVESGFSAYLKISEGCDHRCAFCIIPQLRGKLRSRRSRRWSPRPSGWPTRGSSS